MSTEVGGRGKLTALPVSQPSEPEANSWMHFYTKPRSCCPLEQELPAFRINAPHWTCWRTDTQGGARRSYFSQLHSQFPLSHMAFTLTFSVKSKAGAGSLDNSSLKCKLWWLSRRFLKNFINWLSQAFRGERPLRSHLTVKLQPFRIISRHLACQYLTAKDHNCQTNLLFFPGKS